MKIDLALFNAKALLLELLRNVSSSDGAEQLAFLANACRECERDLLELCGDFLRGPAALALGSVETIALLLDALEVSGRRLVGEVVREEIVPSVAVLDFHDVPRLSEILDGVTKDDFHEKAPGYEVGRARRRQSAHVSPRPRPKAAMRSSKKPTTAAN